MIKLNRNKVLLLGLVLISTIYFLNRGRIISSGEFAEGRISGVDSYKTSIYITGAIPTYTTTTKPVVQFAVNDTLYTIQGTENSGYTYDDKIKILYNPKNPENAYIFSFTGFWWEGLLFTILMPGLLFILFVFSFYNRRDVLIVDLKKFRVKVDRPENKDGRIRKELYRNLKQKEIK